MGVEGKNYEGCSRTASRGMATASGWLWPEVDNSSSSFPEKDAVHPNLLHWCL